MRKLYIDIARSKEKYIPVMSDFYDILMAQPEDEAKDIALSLELFVNGSLNIFNHQTNVDVDNRFTVYGIRDLGTELSPIGDEVMITDKNGLKHIYEVIETEVVNPYDNSIKTQGTEKELTLFTCSQKGTMRFVVRCIYKEAVMDE